MNPPGTVKDPVFKPGKKKISNSFKMLYPFTATRGSGDFSFQSKCSACLQPTKSQLAVVKFLEMTKKTVV